MRSPWPGGIALASMEPSEHTPPDRELERDATEPAQVGANRQESAEALAHSTTPGLFTRLGPAGIVGVVSAVLPALGGFVLLGSLNTVGPWLAGEQGLTRGAGLALYAAVFAISSGLALLPTYAQAALGGWAFGLGAGLPAAMIGFFGGALLGYEVGLRASGDRVIDIIDENPRYRAVRDALIGNSDARGATGPGFWRTLGLVTLIRLPANSPFALTNLVMASVRVPRVAYALGTLIGLTPRTAIAIWLASSIEGTINSEALQATKKGWLIAGSFGVFLVVLVVIGVIANRAIARLTTVGAEDGGGPGVAGS